MKNSQRPDPSNFVIDVMIYFLSTEIST